MSDPFGSIPIQPEPPATPKPERVEPPKSKRPIRPKKQMRGPGLPKTALVLLFMTLLVGGYIVAGFWGVPRYLGNSLPELVRQQTGLDLTLGKVQFSPFTFELNISDIVVSAGEDAAEPLLALKSLVADVAPLPLFKAELISTQLRLDDAQVNLVRNSEGKYNVFQARPEDGRGGTPRPLDLGALPFRFSLNNISLSNGKLTFHDIPNNNTHVVEQIDLSLPNLSNFSFQAGEYIRPSFSAVINGSPIQLTGQAVLTGNNLDTNAGLKTELSCNFNSIDLNRYFDYLPFRLPFDVTGGKAQGTLKLTFAPSDATDMLSADFSMQAADLALASSDDSFRLQIPTAKLEGAIQPLTGKTHLKTLELREPSAQVAPSFSFTHFRALAGLASFKSQQSGQGGPQISIDHFLADSGSIALTGDDPQKTRASWEAIQFSLKNYRNTTQAETMADRPTFRLSGEQTGTRATFSLQGHIDEHLLPAGDLLVTNIEAKELFPLLGLGNIAADSGTADVQAFLSFKDYPDLDIINRITVAEGIISFKDLTLTENNHVWFSAPASKIAGFGKEGRKLSFGSVYLKNSSLDLHTDALPAIFKRLGGEKGNVSIQALEFTGALTLSDSAGQRPALDFSEVSLQAINLARLESSSERDNLTFTARLGKTGEIQAKGKVRLNAFITTLTTGFSGIDGRQLLPWFGDSKLISEATLTLAGKGEFSYPFISYNGKLLLQNGSLSRKDKKNKDIPYITWQEINLQDFRYTGTPLSIGASQCTLVAPRMDLTLSKQSPHPAIALGNFLNNHFKGRQESGTEKNKGPVLALQKVAISAGMLGIEDKRLSPPWKAEIGGLSGTLENLSSDPAAKPSPYSLRGDFEAIAFFLQGSVNLFAPSRQGSAEFSLEGFPLSPFRVALKTQLGIEADHGTVAVKDHTTWGNGMLTRNSELTVGNVLPVSKTSETALTLALLTGDDDSFTLQVRSEQPLSDAPSLLLTDAVNDFRKLVLKAAVSPLLLVAADHADLIGQEYADFEPGKIFLTGKGQESLARFTKLLSAHPGIALTVTGSADAVIDGEAMKRDLEAAEQQRVAEENEHRKEALQKAAEEYLLQAAEKRKKSGATNTIVEEKIPREIYRRYAPIEPEKVVIDKAMLQNLARERARIVAELFTEQLAVAPERITAARKVVVNEDEKNQGNRVLFTIGISSRSTGK